MLTDAQIKQLLFVYTNVPERLRLIKMQMDALCESHDNEAYAASVTQVTDGLPRSPQPGNKTASIAVRLVTQHASRLDALAGRKAALVNFEQQMRTALGTLPELDRAILTEKYMRGNSWTQVYFKLTDQYPIVSERTLQRRARVAVAALGQLVDLSRKDYKIISSL